MKQGAPRKGGLAASAARTAASVHGPARQQTSGLVGNQVFQQLADACCVRTKLPVSRPGDCNEVKADQMADRLMRIPAPSSSLRSACAAGPKCRGEGGGTLHRKAEAGGAVPAVADRAALGLGAGRPLDAATRAFFEPRLGADLGPVRVHTDKRAAEAATGIRALAFTLGRDIVFGPGQYSPGTEAGRRLLAHELTHTIQQRVMTRGFIQRQETGGTAGAAITARNIFPFPAGSRVTLNRILSDDWFERLAIFAPDVAAALGAIERQTATVTSATDDLFEVMLDRSVVLPARGGRAATTLTRVTVRLERRPDGAFDFSLSGRTEAAAEPTPLFAQGPLAATREEGAIVLAGATGPRLRMAPGAGGEEVRIGAYTAPYLESVPEWARGLAPPRLDLIRITRLPDVRPGTAEEERAVERITSQVTGQRRTRSQRVVAGAGIQAGGGVDPLLTTAWQMTWTPIPKVGTLFQLPLEVQVQYVPTKAILGEISTGIEASLSQVEVPVNVRLNLGWAGGQIYGEAPPAGGERPLVGALGPVLGGGAGLELGVFRMDLRYEHLFNLWYRSPDLNSVYLRLGGAF